MADSISSFTAANKAAWNASASLHSRGAEWDSLLEQAARPDFSVLDPELRETIRALGLKANRRRRLDAIMRASCYRLRL